MNVNFKRQKSGITYHSGMSYPVYGITCDRLSKEQILWLSENIIGDYFVTIFVNVNQSDATVDFKLELQFVNEEEAAAFKLRWS